MAYRVEMELQGARKLLRHLERLGPQGHRAVIRALSAGAGVFKTAAKQAAPKQTRLLVRSLGVIRIREKDGGYRFRVQPRKGWKRAVRRTASGRLVTMGVAKARRVQTEGAALKYRNPQKYAHLTELGHQIVRGGKAFGRVRGSHWLLKACRGSERSAIYAIERKAKKEYQRIRK